MFLDNYPEILKCVYVLNASSYFTLVFPLVKAILSGSILNKITIFGKDGYKEELLKVIDAETLPAFLGGKKTDSDGNPRCETYINWAGPVPEKYFLTKNIAKISKRKDIKKVIVPNKTCHEVKIQVNQCNMILEWEYELKNHDIGFKIMFEDRNPDGIETMEIIPMYKFETEYEPIKGMLRCKRKGTYIIGFDNSYSWFNSKEVYYKVWLTTTKDKTND
ncbi:retinal-binding protein [Trichonephila clavata]|uniref:Retinal-binding protein n=1 Tax=Trichonephila clavata TaxID=2740835 RepID=A0A8X6HXY8_TRICU|nr:retinal-binding protein [Trichonephila clavata]